MTNDELIAKVDSGQGLTMTEIKRYRRLVKPQKHLYGKYGTLAKMFMEEHARQADELYNTMSAKLSQTEQYRRTGDYVADVRRIAAMQKAIEDEILTELVYVV